MNLSALNRVMEMDVLIASALIFFTLISILAFFFRWINLIFIITFGVASFFYTKNLIKSQK